MLAAPAGPRDYEILRRNQRGIDRLAFAEHVRRQFGRLKIGCVLDVGANRGPYRDFLRDRVGYTGRIVSFEPIADLATLLGEQAAAEDPEWKPPLLRPRGGRAAARPARDAGHQLQESALGQHWLELTESRSPMAWQ